MLIPPPLAGLGREALRQFHQPVRPQFLHFVQTQQCHVAIDLLGQPVVEERRAIGAARDLVFRPIGNIAVDRVGQLPLRRWLNIVPVQDAAQPPGMAEGQAPAGVLRGGEGLGQRG